MAGAIAAGDTVLIDCPSHALDNKKCLVGVVIFVTHPSLPSSIGFGLEHIAGTAAAAQRRAWEAETDDERQGSLLL